MTALNANARAVIQEAGVTVAGYVRWAGWSDGAWHGDQCGCTDDRCIGFHHDEHEDCGCLPVLLDQMRGWSAPGHHLAADPATSYPNGMCRGALIATPTGQCRTCGYTKAGG